MNPALATVACVVHDLGLAANFGGSLFGKAALRPATRAIGAKEERTRVLRSAWTDFSAWNAISLAAVGATWLLGRSVMTGAEVDPTARRLVLAKDVLVGATIASGLGSMITGYLVSRARKEPLPALEAGVAPRSIEPSERPALRRTSDALGYVNLAAGAALIGVTAALAMRSRRSPSWGLLSRVFA